MSAATPVHCVGSRVDALTVAYRVTFDPAFMAALEARAELARRFGRAALEYRRPGDGAMALAGELRYSRAARCYDVTTKHVYRLRIDLHATGKVERLDAHGERADEAGWTLEIVWAAERLAEWGLARCLDESAALARALGAEVHEECLRRIDLCADLAGWHITPEDADRIVKRPRASKDVAREADDLELLGLTDDEKLARRTEAARKAFEDGETSGPTSYETGRPGKRKVCGLSVGRGGALMARIYDKRLELGLKWKASEPGKVRAEEERWRASGWDGDAPVTRVEFQIRGAAVRELGIRNPRAVLETVTNGRKATGQRVMKGDDGRPVDLVARLPWLWATCLEWTRLVEPDPEQRYTSRLKDDPRWVILRGVRFGLMTAGPVKRFRMRAAASEAQALGVALSQAGKAGELEDFALMSENAADYFPEGARAHLLHVVHALCIGQADRVAAWLLERHDGNAAAACAHVAVRARAARARFSEAAGLVRASPDARAAPPVSRVIDAYETLIAC